MVIRGRPRGNGKQLATYLLTPGENDRIEILDLDGYGTVKPKIFSQALHSMALTSELTKGEKGLYHAQINPAYGEDGKMTREHWLQAADILGKELGLGGQRRAIVLHTKKERTHAHVVWERYDLESGKMISDSFSRLAQDRARKDMERIFAQAKTPERNPRRPAMKQALTKLWQQAKSGKEFIETSAEAGYIVAEGVQRRPFMVVDETGRSFDLVRQLDKVKTKDVRERLKGQKLPKEKAAITTMQQKSRQKNLLEGFVSTRSDIETLPAQHRTKTLTKQFLDNEHDIEATQKALARQKQFEAMQRKQQEAKKKRDREL